MEKEISNLITTEAWTIRPGDEPHGMKDLVLEEVSFADINDQEVLAEPLYGCWEANMEHALRRSPIDICKTRNEDRVVMGNAGVVRIVDVGKSVTAVSEGDTCIVFCNGNPDSQGYPIRILGYDAPNTTGVLAKKIKLHQKQVIRIPNSSVGSLQQWAAFSLRYVTAWANWRVAHGCWRTQMTEVCPEASNVFGWGGGVSVAELSLAKHYGFRATMITSKESRAAKIDALGFEVINRSSFNEQSYEADFLNAVRHHTGNLGVDIFVDNIGANFRATVKALARQGVITTSGWREGMVLPIVRAAECINRHIHVFTHYARYQEGIDAVEFAEQHEWLPSVDGNVYTWDQIPSLAADYAAGKLDTYFPIFIVNSAD